MCIDIGIGLAMIGGKDIIVKLLGPTADYLGNETKNLVEKSCNNLKHIFIHATTLLGTEIESPGQVSPRILKRIFDDGAFCEDELTLDYFGGVLASSRNCNLRDDRGLIFLSLLESMSSYQIRTHYILYTIAKELFDGKNFNLNIPEERMGTQVFLPFDVYLKSMDFKNPCEFNLTFSNTVWGLKRLDLVKNINSAGEDNLKELHCQVATVPGILFTPSVFGIEFYMWAHGYSDTPHYHFFDKDVQFTKTKLLDIPSGALPTNYKLMLEYKGEVEKGLH